jgi:hypothetical protein
MGERIAKPAAGGLQLAALVQHDEIAAGGYVFSHPLGCSKYTRALQVAGGRATAEIIEHRETLATSDGPQIPGVASPIGKPMTFGEGSGDPYLELPAGNKSRQALLDNRIGCFRLT